MDRRPGLGGLLHFVGEVLRGDTFRLRMAELDQYRPRRIINPLLAFLYSTDEEVKWHAVTAVGHVTARMARDEMEAARNIMRRLIWNLNDESGGIGWGSGEAMGEIMAREQRIAEEFAPILISYIREDGNKLENDLLERGVLWGVGRLAQERPEKVQCAAVHLVPYLASCDSLHRGLAAWILGFLDATAVKEAVKPLLDDVDRIRMYENEELKDFRVADLAARIFPIMGEGTKKTMKSGKF